LPPPNFRAGYAIDRNQVRRLIENAKREYFEKTIIKNTKDFKILWQNVKKLINLKGTTKQCPQKIVSSNGDILAEPSDIANEFDSRFSEIGLKLAKTNSSIYGGLRFQHSCSSSFYLYETSENQVMFLIENLAEGKAQ